MLGGWVLRQVRLRLELPMRLSRKTPSACQVISPARILILTPLRSLGAADGCDVGCAV